MRTTFRTGSNGSTDPLMKRRRAGAAMRIWWSLPLFLLAGCSDAPADDATLDAPPGDAAASSAVPAPSLPMDPGAASGRQPVAVLPFEESGHLGTGACVPTGTSSCMGGAVTPGVSDWRVEQRAASWTARLNMTWSADAAGMDRLVLSVAPYRPCGDACWETVGDRRVVEGPSPLRLDAAIPAPEDAIGLWVSVNVPGNLPAGYGFVSTEQDVEVVGTLTVW